MIPALTATFAAILLAAAPAFDTILLRNGGRVVGTIVEEDPASGVTVQVAGGSLRKIPAAEVFRIEYRDGTFGVTGATPPAAEAEPAGAAPAPEGAPGASAQAPAGPPAAAGTEEAPGAAAPPPGPAQVYPAVPVGPPRGAPLVRPAPPRSFAPSPFTLGFGLGLISPSGDAEQGIAMSDLFRTQLLLQFEGGYRFTPHLTGSLVVDLGVGESAPPVRNACRGAGGSDCSAMSVRFGPQLRWAFTPEAPGTFWVSAATSYTMGLISYEASSSSNDLVYSGWEALRLGVGYDFRRTPDFGWGLFLSSGWGRYDEVEDGLGVTAIAAKTRHTWVQGGVRWILNP